MQTASTPNVWDDIWNTTHSKAMVTNVLPLAIQEREGIKAAKVLHYITQRCGPINKLKTIEIGAGRSLYSFLLAQMGASVSVMDCSQPALDLTQKQFATYGLAVNLVPQNAFEVEAASFESYDVVMSFDPLKHFKYPERFNLIKVQTDLVRSQGVVAVGVPNRFFFPHEFLKAYLHWQYKWDLGYERASTRQELLKIASELNLYDAQIVGSAFIHDLKRYWQIFRAATPDEKIYQLSHLDEWNPKGSRQEPPYFLNDLLGANLVLLGTKAWS